MAQIIYTITDEAPALATRSFLPIVSAFLEPYGISIDTKNISLACRILSEFSDFLDVNQKVENSLISLSKIVKQPEANVIKLPNISASVPQLKEAINELQSKGFKLPKYPDHPNNNKEREIKIRYDKIKGSAVNPVLREGNSDRRAPKAVKNFAKRNPHSMGVWKKNSKTHVSSMKKGDFFHNEKSITIDEDSSVDIVHIDNLGKKTILKSNIKVSKDEIVDTTVMNVSELEKFIINEIEDAKKSKLLISLHLKATMMKVSDPIIFGHVIRIFFADIFNKYKLEFDEIGVNPNNGLDIILGKLNKLNSKKRKEILRAFQKAIEEGPDLAMVNHEKGITNLHIPSDVIIDASMPSMIRESGKMYNSNGKLQDTKAIIPDSSYSAVYSTTIEFCKKFGAFDPTSMGTVPNIGLMAQKAEEYGSHDKTFEVKDDGVIYLIDKNKKRLTNHIVSKGDIWRMCQVKDAPIQDWVKLAVARSKSSKIPAVFWLDPKRPHDAELIKKVSKYLNNYDTTDLDFKILPPAEATEYTLKRLKNGLNTLSVTGNVLRDYLTDLFPILEVGTSAKMLSIVPLMNGGGLFETGAGGSAPKHVEQFINENHLRWDSLGEFLALTVSLEHFSQTHNHSKAAIFSSTLEDATEQLLMEMKSPSRKVNELDSRGSHFYLALYWADALSNQDDDLELKNSFSLISNQLHSNQAKILEELLSVQGNKVDLGGYYLVDKKKVENAMRPSPTFNAILNQ